ncbi:MAG: insulinase family protein [Nitrospirae bacterium]|nr:insulinase family protein [Nitrospirota bacterium]
MKGPAAAEADADRAIVTPESVSKTVFENGLRLLTRDVPSSHSVAVGLWVESGSSSEPTDQAGLSHFLEHLLFKGTPTRSAREIALQVEQVGGMLNAFTGREATCFYIRVLHSDLPLAVDILADIYHNPLFDAGELEKERGVILQEIKMVEDTPDDLVHDLLHRNLWGDTSFGLPVLGTAETVHALRREQIVTFFRRMYVPSRSVLAVAGRVDVSEVERRARAAFERRDPRPGGANGSSSPPSYRRARRTHERELEQVHLCLAYPAFSETDPRRYALSLVNTYLGGGMSSELFQEVREKRGLVYTIYSFLSLYREVGYTGVYAGVEPNGLNACLGVTLHEIRKVAREGMSAEALERTKAQVKGQVSLGMESNFNLMQKLAKDEFLFQRHVPLEEILASIDAVKLDDARDIAAQVYGEDGLAMTLLGPAPAAEDLVRLAE